MKGLLTKDIRLLASQKNFFAVVIVVAFLVTMSTDNPSFAVGYVAFVFPMFTLSTISYDDFDNGYAFLFTLPVTKKEYVLEKYIFGLILGGIPWFCVTMIIMLYQMVKVPEFVAIDWFIAAVCMIGIMVLLLSVVIPIVLKFGGDKSRIVLLLIVGAVMAGAFVLNNVLDSLQLDMGDGLQKILSAINTGSMLGILFIVLIVILLISIKISMRIMEKKEF